MKSTSIPHEIGSRARPASPPRKTSTLNTSPREAAPSPPLGERAGVRWPSPPTTPDSEPLLTKEEVAVHCQVCVRTIDDWMKRGALKYLKIRSRVRFRLSDVDRHLTEFYGNSNPG